MSPTSRFFSAVFFAIPLVAPAFAAPPKRPCVRVLAHALEEDRARLAESSEFLARIREAAGIEGFTVLPRNPRAVTLAEEVSVAGRLVAEGFDSGTLADDLYVYLVDRSGAVFVAPRIQETATGKTLATHRSLAAAMRAALGREPEIVAAGEFEILRGRVAELNTKCSTFLPPGDRLPLAKTALSRAGIRIEAGTVLRDAAAGQIPDAHFAEKVEVEALLALRSSVAGQGVLEAHRTLQKTLSETFPSPVPGRYEHGGDRMMEWLFDRHPEFFDPSDAFDLEFQSVLIKLQDARERYGTLKIFVDRFGLEPTRERLARFAASARDFGRP